MKKRYFVLGMIALVLVSGCEKNAKNIDKIDQTKISQAQKKNRDKIESSPKMTTQEENEGNLFDELPESIKIVLFANLEYPDLEGLVPTYQISGDNVYFQLTSGADSGHSIYRFEIEKDGVKPLQAVSYMGAGADRIYDEVEINNAFVSKKQMYAAYLSDKKKYEFDSQKVERSDQLEETFNTMLKNAEVSEKKADGTVVVNIPNEDMILQYFKEYVMDDFGLPEEEYKMHAHYGIDENGDPMIRYVGGKGAYTNIEGNRIIYREYSFGGVSEDGVVEKSVELQRGFYDFVTGEHGKL